MSLRTPISIPRDRLTIRFSRSGGPGGQNVNKVATRVEVRFRLDEADWLPATVRDRLRSLQRRRINQEGELIVVSSRFREQRRNLEDCLEKLQRMVEAARRLPKRRKVTRPTRASRERRLKEKSRRSQLKKARKKPAEDD